MNASEILVTGGTGSLGRLVVARLRDGGCDVRALSRRGHPGNEHLVSNYGAMNLALGVLLVSAALFLERRLTQVALLTYLAFATPHFFFHAAQTHHFSFLHNVLQLGSLGLLVLLPVALLILITVSVPHTRGKSPRWNLERKGETTL